jgi:hypothetical protein
VENKGIPFIPCPWKQGSGERWQEG